MKVLGRYLKHFLIVSLVLVIFGAIGVISQHGSINFGDNPLAFKVGDEGPHMFHQGNDIDVLYIRGGREPGFQVEKNTYPVQNQIKADVYFPVDQSTFEVTVKANYSTPPAIYNDNQPIFAMSDLEGNYQTFRDFLITHDVINENLTWNFAKGHLVLVGDMVDRGSSTTQLLWLIYKLEREAELVGGKVHYIIGNHELKNMQGNFKSTANKYLPIAGILGKQQHELFGKDAVIGRWLASKNIVERINGYLFVHGGWHPDMATVNLTLAQINQLQRDNYRQFYFPRLDTTETEQLILSKKTGPAWYRGFFKDDLSQQQIEQSLKPYAAKGVVVGHTIQFKVNQIFDGKVMAIDVKHPDDYRNSFPVKHSEGLLIDEETIYRLLDDGQRVTL